MVYLTFSDVLHISSKKQTKKKLENELANMNFTGKNKSFNLKQNKKLN